MDCPPTLDPADAALLEAIHTLGAKNARRVLTPLMSPARVRKLDHLIRVEYARALLLQRVERAVIAERIAAAGCSMRTAYRAIEAALELETVSRTRGR